MKCYLFPYTYEEIKRFTSKTNCFFTIYMIEKNNLIEERREYNE